MTEKQEIKKVTFWDCSDGQANFGSGKDPRGLLEKGKEYDVANIDIHDWYTLYYIKVNNKLVPFNSGCFFYQQDNPMSKPIIELPEKLQAIIADTDNVFVVRIGTDPRTTDTGIANIICQGTSRADRDRVIAIANHLVKCWNEQGDLINQAALGEAPLVKFEQLATDERAGLAVVCEELLAIVLRYEPHTSSCATQADPEDFGHLGCTCEHGKVIEKANKILYPTLTEAQKKEMAECKKK